MLKVFAFLTAAMLLSTLHSTESAAVIVDHHGNTRVAQSLPVNCNYHCTKNDLPSCAWNGQCMMLFQSECVMSSYNCEHPQKPFVIVDTWKCHQSWAPLCKRYELGHQ